MSADADRRLARDLTAPRPNSPFSFCRFCGVPSLGPTCHEHRDLLALDPNYSTARRR